MAEIFNVVPLRRVRHSGGVSSEEFTLDQAVETSKVSYALRVRR